MAQHVTTTKDSRIVLHHVGGRSGSRAFPILKPFERDFVSNSRRRKRDTSYSSHCIAERRAVKQISGFLVGQQLNGSVGGAETWRIGEGWPPVRAPRTQRWASASTNGGFCTHRRRATMSWATS